MVIMMDFQPGGHRFDAHHCRHLLFPWARNFTPIVPVCCADGYTTVLLCRVHVDCMYYQGTAEKQYFYTKQSSLLIKINKFKNIYMRTLSIIISN